MGRRLLPRLRALDDRAGRWLRERWQRAFPERVEHDEELPGSWPLTVPEEQPNPEHTCRRCGSPGTLSWAAMGGADLWDGWACTVCPHRWAVRASA